MSFSFGGGGASTGGFGFGGTPATTTAAGTPAPAFGGYGAPVRRDICGEQLDFLRNPKPKDYPQPTNQTQPNQNMCKPYP